MWAGIRSGSRSGGSTVPNLCHAGTLRRCSTSRSGGGVGRRLDAVLDVSDRFGAIGGGPLSSSIALAAVRVALPAPPRDHRRDRVRLLRRLRPSPPALIADLGLRGRAAEIVQDAIDTAEGSRRAASIVGLVGLLWSGLGVVGSLQTALNATWQAKGRGLLDRLVALRWLLGTGALFLASAALGPLLRWAPGPGQAAHDPRGPRPHHRPVRLDLPARSATATSAGGCTSPASLLVAVGFEVLKVVGAIIVPRTIASSSALYGSLGVVFAVLAWLLVYGRLIVYGAVLNVVRYEKGAGTVTVEIEVPRIEGEVPLTTNRGGAVDEKADAG